MFVCLAMLLLAGCDRPSNAPVVSSPTPYLSPAESLQHIELQDGYHLELVLSEPDIREPVAAAFDGNGRLYVAEMRAFMQDIAGTNQMAPIGRVSRHESTRHDGVYDRHTVFADHLVLPRMILPLADGVVIGESGTSTLNWYSDTNGDGIADVKRVWSQNGASSGNVEHEPSGLLWSLDNWIYSALRSTRQRVSGTNVIVEQTPANGGQWGIAQDDYGKPWVVNAGMEFGPVNFQQHFLYGGSEASGQLAPGFTEVWPLPTLPDAEAGSKRLRWRDHTLNHFTSTCGPEIYRGDRLPADLRGDLLFAEPVGRLIRRAKVEDHDGITILRNAYEKTEFIRSSDPNFRPINLLNGPDGCLYIVDMYRGVIQEAQWLKPGSYLHRVVEEHQLDRNIGRGRIWRLVHGHPPPAPWPALETASSAELVKHLADAGGWWRDTAQRLLVLRQDRSAVPALQLMMRSHTNVLARVHALWTLEGLGALDAPQLREKLHDADPQVRMAAIRAGETLYQQRDLSLIPDTVALLRDPDPQVVSQVLLTANRLHWPGCRQLASLVHESTMSKGGLAVAERVLAVAPGFGDNFTEAETRFLRRGEIIYHELCFACHGMDGLGTPMEGAGHGATLAPPLAKSATVQGSPEGLVAVLLDGLTGPVQGRHYDAQMVPMESNGDSWIAAVASYVRNSFGNSASLVRQEDVTALRQAIGRRTVPWTLEEIESVLPHRLVDRSHWKATASHKPELAALALDGQSNTCYYTQESQAPGMWFQVEMPAEKVLSGVMLDAVGSVRNRPRQYEVLLSRDGRNWGPPVAAGEGKTGMIEVRFSPQKARFVRVVQTGHDDTSFWCIYEFNLLTPPEHSFAEAKAASAK